ncbi:MAG: valine--tRNA ligase [Puniceicoccales bacterium]|jgi:valyl-tRNA synthetase|nr:valine--tRNA ligase [Puniceicoccales bacterium]
MKVLNKVYYSKDIEKKWNQRWEEAQCFCAKFNHKPAFSILMPPPNVTGILHMGHTLNNVIQDILCRWARIQGKEVLWIPGTDHAGIATQSKVEKELNKEGLSAKTLGREAFIRRAQDWRNKHGHIIYDQLKSLGVSCDWSRTTYTLDPQYSCGVLTAFVRLYESGYIYKGKRLVHWCPVSQTALSDEEVIMKIIPGKLYTFFYKIVEKEDTFIPIATTRPETLMGDVAVAVHPEDPRYQHFIGLHCQCPFANRTIPIITDKAVEKDFGTGALKITPAHSFIDFEVGKRHELPLVNIFNPDATLNEYGAPFQGMDRLQAREAVVEALKSKGLLQKIEDYEHSVGHSERSHVPVEPYLSEQWFLRYPKVKEAQQCIEEGYIDFWPERWIKTYQHWLNNIQDWCISRQLWWGHRIPVWYHKKDPQNMHVSVEGPQDPENWNQDPDVLDTWFSSWLWPFCTAGWPNKETLRKNDFDRFFPSHTLVSGPDILFFWITRMIIASLELLEDRPMSQRIPFQNVYLTGIVRDSIGRKMSKSLGNSPDPIDLMHTYGADGVRIGLLSIAPQGQDIRFDACFLTQGRNFCTKLWNACRFRQMQNECVLHTSLQDFIVALDQRPLSLYDQHLLIRLYSTLQTFESCLKTFEFNAAIKRVQQFFKNEFCDWYLEILKYAREQTIGNPLAVQDLCLRQVLIMLSPFAPFIAEELWEQLQFGKGFIHEAGWDLTPLQNFIHKYCSQNLKQIETIEVLRGVVGALRSLKAECKLSACKQITLYACLRETCTETFKQHWKLIQRLAGFQSIEYCDASSFPIASAATTTTSWGTFALLIEQSIHNSHNERQRIQKDIHALSAHIASAELKLSNENFINHAPQEIIEGVKNLLKDNLRKREDLQKLLK